MRRDNTSKWQRLTIIAGSILVIVFFGILLIKSNTEVVDAATNQQSDVVQIQNDNPSTAGLLQDISVLNAALDAEPQDCLSCHKKELSYHDKLGQANRACWTCHVSTDVTMKTLQLADGTPIALSESTQLCGQCHQKRYAAWQEGTHGIPGTIAAVPCTGCHNPHQPQVALLNLTLPQPPPLDSKPQIPRDAFFITGISVVVLLGIAGMLTRHRNNI